MKDIVRTIKRLIEYKEIYQQNELWPWKCSAINRQLIVGKYEWGNEFSTVSRMGLVKLNS